MDSDDNPILSDEEESELTTAAEVVKKLEEVWVNEKLSPELLNYEDELVDCLLDQIQHMEQSLVRVKKEDFRLVFHKMELERIKYVLCSYLRIRLEKVEKFGPHLLKVEADDPSLRNQMSAEERKFATEFVSNMKSHLQDVALNQMPANMQTLPMEEMCMKPCLDSSVFIRLKKECKGVILQSTSEYEDDEIIDLARGTQHILPYRSVAPLLKSGSLQLI